MKLLDTNVVSDFLRPEASRRWPRLHDLVDRLARENGLAIASITRYEIRRGLEALRFESDHLATANRKLVEFEKFAEVATILGLDTGHAAGWDCAARLWAEARAMKPAWVFKETDLLIGATAKFYRLVLVTRDQGLSEGLDRLGIANELIARE